jgi:hypothetical protein
VGKQKARKIILLGMIEQFSYLSKDEQEVVMNAPALVTALIAGTDKDVDGKEVNRGLDLMKWKSFRARPDLLDYYHEVSKSFPARLDQILKELPEEKEARNAWVGHRLSKLNPIFPKFDKEFAEQLYASYRELAKHIAESSGGFLGYLSVNFEESRLIKLPMIDDPREYKV